MYRAARAHTDVVGDHRRFSLIAPFRTVSLSAHTNSLYHNCFYWLLVHPIQSQASSFQFRSLCYYVVIYLHITAKLDRIVMQICVISEYADYNKPLSVFKSLLINQERSYETTLESASFGGVSGRRQRSSSRTAPYSSITGNDPCLLTAYLTRFTIGSHLRP